MSFPHVLSLFNIRKLEEESQADNQALGQSSTFLNTHLPNTKRISTASTALAAESLLGPISFRDSDRAASEAEGVIGRAAICSSSVVGIYPELEVLYEGTQDRSGMSPSSLNSIHSSGTVFILFS